MRIFSKEETPVRSKLIKECHTLLQGMLSKFSEEEEAVKEDWRKLFDTGNVAEVENLIEKARQTVNSQLKASAKLVHLIIEQENDIKDQKKELEQHFHYSELVKKHFAFGEDIQKTVGKEELDLENIMKALQSLRDALQLQNKILLNMKGTGQAAYGEQTLREAVEKERKILSGIKPFWYDWEVAALKVEHLIENLGEMDPEEEKQRIQEIKDVIKQYHKEYTDDNKAAQIGSELAVNLYIRETEQVNQMKGIPITIINIDMTACNELDGSHKLGDELIRLGYEELNSRFGDKKFIKVKDGEPVQNVGIVTLSGRTKYKIVGITKKEIEKALAKIPATVLSKILKSEPAQKFYGTIDEAQLRELNTRMLAGYKLLKIGEERDAFLAAANFVSSIKKQKIIEKLKEKKAEYVENNSPNRTEMIKATDKEIKSTQEALQAELKNLKRREITIANKVDEAIKNAAAKAEYLEKKIFPELIEKREQEFEKIVAQKGLVPGTIEYDNELIKLEKQIPIALVYDEQPEELKSWLGRNYIPEAEFGQQMIGRIAHQIGLDLYLTNNFFKLYQITSRAYRKGKMTLQQADQLKKFKDQFYQDVLQKRFHSKAKDLRFPKVFREDPYDELMPMFATSEGPQIMTFFELDGFNAFNSVYSTDNFDTYYHLVLDAIFNAYDETIEPIIKQPMRMTKQGDEIWISYPKGRDKIEISENVHKSFLEKFQKMLVSRDEGALVLKNLQKVEWIPLLLLDKNQVKLHLQNALSQQQKVYLAENSSYDPKKEMAEDQPEIWSQNQIFQKGIISEGFVPNVKGNKDELDMSRWVSLYPVRQVAGESPLVPKDFRLSEMLFRQTKKATLRNASRRPYTGMVVRLGSTIGYAGFDEPIGIKSEKHCKAIRKKLGEAVEHMREQKGRGGYHNLQKEGYKF